jgi:hypothetical protein
MSSWYAVDVLLVLSVPATNERGPLYMEQALAALRQGNPGKLPLSLLFLRHGNAVTIGCRCPFELSALLRSQLYAQYPDCRIEELSEEELRATAHTIAWSMELSLRPEIFPLRRYAQFEDPLNRVTADPLTPILATLAGRADDELSPSIDISIIPASEKRARRARRAIERFTSIRSERLALLYATHAASRRIGSRLLSILIRLVGRSRDSVPSSLESSSTSRSHEREDDVQAAGDKVERPLFETTIRLSVTAPPTASAEAKRKLREMAGAFGQFHNRKASFHSSHIRRRPRLFTPKSSLLSTEELASLWHPATVAVRAATMKTVQSRELEPAVDLPTPQNHPELAILGLATFRSQQRLCGILPDDRRRHVAIQGKTGMGKSTLLHQLITSDVLAGHGVALIDPHGDLCDAVLASVPKTRTNDVILFDAGDTHYPLAFNLLACADAEQRALVASGMVSAFKKLYREFWGPRLEDILRNALLALLETPGTSLLSLLRFLTDARYRDPIVGKLSDPIVKSYWQQRFASMPSKLQAEALSPVLNKIGHFASSPILRHIIGQAQSRLNLRTVMDEGKVLLVNLSKGRIGDDASALLGSFLVTAIQLAAMSRADKPEEERRDFFCFVDEFQNFASDSFPAILSEARKYRLNLTVANQCLAQMDEPTLAAVFGNIGTLISFQVGAQDADTIAQQLGAEATPQDVMGLPRYQAYVRLLIEGMPSRPFSLRTLPPVRGATDPQRPAIIQRYSRNRYARPVAQVEREIATAFGA